VGGKAKPMLISSGSPLRHLQSDMPREQVLVLDGIRYAAEMVALASARLYTSLVEFSKREQGRPLPDNGFVAAFTDAWTIIDAVHRLCGLVLRVQLVDVQTDVDPFLATTEAVKRLRNCFQHLDGRIPALRKARRTVWGTLSWVQVTPERDCDFRLHTLVAGTMMTSRHEIVDFRGKKVQSSIALVTLAADDAEADLNSLTAATAQIIKAIESKLEAVIRPGEQAGADVHTVMECAWGTGEDGTEFSGENRLRMKMDVNHKDGSG